MRKERERGNERDQVKRIWYVFCAYSFSSLWHLKIIFPFRRIGLKNRKISRNLLKQLGCVLNFLWRYISMEESIIMSTISRANVLLFAHEVVGITMV